MPLITAGTVVLEQRLCRPGWVHTSGSQIVDCGSGSAPHPPDVDLPDAVVVPGFVDIHVHGGGGASYTDGNTSDNVRAASFHRRHGTTTTLASLVTAPAADLLAAVRALAESTAERRYRRYPSGGAVAERGALRGARPHPVARPGADGDRRPPGRRQRGDQDGHPGTRTPRQRRRDHPPGRRRSGCRPWAYGCELRADPSCHRARRNRRHPPVQCDAATASPRARARACAAGGSPG